MTKRAGILGVVLAVLAAVLVATGGFNPRVRGEKTLADFSDDEITYRFIEIYWRQRAVHQGTYWMGIKTQQAPPDLWSVQEIISEVKPDFVIETGTLFGGSALYFASVLNAVNPAGRVITVDIEDKTEGARRNPLFGQYVIPILGSSVDDKTVSEIRRLVQGRRALVFLDSDHHMNHVLKEMKAYSEFVSVGSYMVVNDTMFKEHPMSPTYGPGPMEAVNIFMRDNKAFELDRRRSRFMLSFYPDGYLKRVS